MSKPQWLPLVEQQLKENPKSTTYAFSTLSEEGKPKVRFVIHRGITSNGLLLTTTDTRMAKPQHLAHSATTEVAWWIEPTNVQFRITGPAATIHPSQDLQKAFKTLGVEGQTDEEGSAEWWENKRKELWKGVSGHLRAGFGRPPPGKKLDEVEGSDKWPETIPAESDKPEEQKTIQNAYDHFAIIAIAPEAVEYLELKPVPNRRTQYRRQGDGEWEETKVAP
ncbi:uncharacterized protein I303_102135 [Kwoniella dejecticola CBS 10117]|uniref:Pyridoxamine 5'-phosphate oxidase Alr4036 family FMN-binding domain-containing protein n=1 Tax=Kwoniella dejecticola CBS 10117 TaxID=1296121 RepID=A0A1A6ABS6_9TREE|nr:uncharacterized protein I303_01724 [Kwoniella dejecticola CBS 10117]OBR87517.1 hypothetical protein I303_01724 [Kwoniella dejecticola CBS 10117]